MVLSGRGFTLDGKTWHIMLPRKTVPSQTSCLQQGFLLKSTCLGGFMEHCGNLESQHVLAARFNLGTWCYYKVFQNVMQHEAGFLSTFT